MTVRPSLNLLVLRARDPERMVSFYQALGLTFTCEKHGTGPEHYACELVGTVFEIYPRTELEAASLGVRLGFQVESIDVVLARVGPDTRVLSPPRRLNGMRRCVLEDPEGHKVELVEASQLS